MADTYSNGLKFGRVIQVAIRIGKASDAKVIENLAVRVEIDKSDGKKPNPGKVKIWNASRDTYALLNNKDAEIVVKAGHASLYGSDPPVLFAGDVQKANPGPTLAGDDAYLDIEARDGGKAFTFSTFNEAVSGDASSHDVLGRIARSMGLGLTIDRGVQATKLGDGGVWMGSAADALTEVCAHTRAEWTIQDGHLLVTPVGEARSGGRIPLLSSDQILGIKPYDQGKGRSKKRGWEVTVPLSPEIQVKGQVQIASSWVTGTFKVRGVKHVADNWDDPFETTIKVQE